MSRAGTATTDFLGVLIENPTTFDRCTFLENEAKAIGGAIVTCRAGLIVITNTYFREKRCWHGGGTKTFWDGIALQLHVR